VEASEKIDNFLCTDIKENMKNLCSEPDPEEITTIAPDFDKNFTQIEEEMDLEKMNEIDVDSKPEDKTSFNSGLLKTNSITLILVTLYFGFLNH